MYRRVSDIPLKNFVLEDTRKDGSAETFVYREVTHESRRGLWSSFLRPTILSSNKLKHKYNMRITKKSM
ncbi:MAG: hypothetical protein N4J56_000659 [Chroococcidiopsis sp. SAG 2025]|nr:hypothetical protein [Chroococcidiopsis sp. SAG 2025]